MDVVAGADSHGSRFRALSDAMAADFRGRQRALLAAAVAAKKETTRARERLRALEKETTARDQELLAALATAKEKGRQLDEEALRRRQLGATLKCVGAAAE